MILIIEDETSLAYFIQKTLQQEGYKVQIAGTGNSGLELAQKNLPEIVLLDIKLPDINGLDVLSKLKNIYKNLHIIMITASADLQTVIKAMKF